VETAPGEKNTVKVRVKRFENNPIIQPDMDGRIGSNINGPSMIRVPDWIANPLGKYYLYFADHKGRYIRLAYGDRPEGPWNIHEPGSLQLEESHFLTAQPDIPDRIPKYLPVPADAPKKFTKEMLDKPRAPHVPSFWGDLTHPHIASPDVHVLNESKEIRMYYHGLEKFGYQISRVATSKDGISFVAQKEIVINKSYLRIFPCKGMYYGMAMPGIFYRSRDGKTGFEKGPRLFNLNMRHAALLVMDDYLLVFWTQVGDAPERILLSTISMSGDWKAWKESPAVEIIRPEYPWEGAGRPVEPSVRSSINTPVNQLRDPAIFRENGRTFLLYVVAGESGIAIAELFFDVAEK
jgi:hypothetical protein